jgi:hypothetical protein
MFFIMGMLFIFIGLTVCKRIPQYQYEDIYYKKGADMCRDHFLQYNASLNSFYYDLLGEDVIKGTKMEYVKQVATDLRMEYPNRKEAAFYYYVFALGYEHSDHFITEIAKQPEYKNRLVLGFYLSKYASAIDDSLYQIYKLHRSQFFKNDSIISYFEKSYGVERKYLR